MNTEYLPTFIKDLKNLKSTSVYDSIKKLVTQDILAYRSLTEIPNIKKIKGAKNAYRLRIGDYRVGFFLEEDKIIFSMAIGF